MTYVSAGYFAFLSVCLALYYLVPRTRQWWILLAASCVFYWLAVQGSWSKIAIFAATVVFSYGGGLLLDSLHQKEKNSKSAAAAAVIVSLLPLLGVRFTEFSSSLTGSSAGSIIVPLGISFYSMQIAAYLIDICRGKIRAEENFLKYALFISFFPQIIQGPIPRWEQLGSQLAEGHEFSEDSFVKGFMLVIWGFFLKFMIAGRAGIIVDTVFNDYQMYAGVYVWAAAVLYSFQLYADFMSCTTISQGVSKMFGIELADNFSRPYFSASVQEFWRRWHMSLSFWLKDYIYISLGGNRKGQIRKYLNVIVTFAVSGLWHGSSVKFLAWGLLHAFYQVYEGLTKQYRDAAYHKLGFADDSAAKRAVRTLGTFFLVMIGWIIFRAGSLGQSWHMIKSLFVFNPWVFFDDGLLTLGLGWKECVLLAVSLLILGFVSLKQEQGIRLCDKVLEQNIAVRWALYLAAIWTVWIFGAYGTGFDARNFIYGGF